MMLTGTENIDSNLLLQTRPSMTE